MLPGFGPGQGIVSGQVVRFPLPVMIKMDSELLASEIGDEDFIQQVSGWKPDKALRNGNAIARRLTKLKKPPHDDYLTVLRAAAKPRHRHEKVRKRVVAH